MALPARTPILFPTELSLSDTATRWIQVAKTGKFYSSKYGNFEISASDLKQMLHNFKNVTPLSPTQLPVDYDHLSMDPKKPGDGKAAGWFAGGMELRAGGSELWAEVEFTPDAATSIKNKEYRFVSPSFVKNYVWKNGENIGTTMIAAAITNHPFLEGMQAVTLSAPVFGELALDLCSCEEQPADPAKKPNPFEKKDGPPSPQKDAAPAGAPKQSPPPGQPGQPQPPGQPPGQPSAAAGVAMDVGQHVAVKAEINPQLAGQQLEVAEVAGAGDDQFAKLKNPMGQPIGWFRVTELEPARSQPPQAAGMVPAPGGIHMSTFKLRDARGEEIEVAEDVLRKIAEEKFGAPIPEGSVVINASKLEALTKSAEEVTTLKAQVESLTKANDEAKAAQHTMHLSSKLDEMSKKGLITKPQRDWASKMYADPMALAAFTEWTATMTQPVVEVGVERGSAEDGGAAPSQASSQIVALAQAYAKEHSVSLRDAIKRVSNERADLTETYQNDYREMSRAKH